MIFKNDQFSDSGHIHNFNSVQAYPLSDNDPLSPKANKKMKWSKKDLVIEKLSQNNRNHYIEVATIFKKMEEKKECTFKPKVNIEGQRYEDVQELFERLHEDKARRDQSLKVRKE